MWAFRTLNFSNFQTARCVLSTLGKHSLRVKCHNVYMTFRRSCENATFCLYDIPSMLQKRNIKLSRSNKIDCFLLPFAAYMSIGLPMIAGLVPFGLPFTNSITFLLICLLSIYWCLQ